VELGDRLSEIESRTGIKKSFSMLFIGLLVSVLMLSTVLVFKKDRIRTVVTPMTIKNSFWVDDENVSDEYLIEMGTFISQLSLDVTPINVDYQQKMLLKYACSSAFGQLQNESGAYAVRIKENSASSMFEVRQFTPDSKRNRIAMHGDLSTFVGDKRVSKVPKIYAITFENKSGTVKFCGMKETNEKDLFGDTPI
jgi:type IV conjugative transfer system protein TraE